MQDSVTVYALVKDQGRNDLVGTEVTFTATSNPAGVFTSTRTDDALEVMANPDATEGEIGVPAEPK